jgi:ribonucleoside-diphosphate reductase alpha chain
MMVEKFLNPKLNKIASFVDKIDENDDEYVYIEEDVEDVYGEKPGEISLCVLSAINVGEIKDLSDLEGIMKNAVSSLDFVIEHQDYPVKAAEKMLKRRSIGIGITNLAYYLAKNNVNYDSPEALEVVDELMEHIQYYGIKASVELAKEFGKCEWFDRTKYSDGILPIDTYSKNVDKLVKRKPTLDWESLRKEVVEHGMRNSTITAIMPCESSSVVTNSTNGMEPLRSLITVKKSKQGLLKTVAPEILKLKNKYQLAYDLNGNKGITNIQSVIQKWIDQGISANHYYDFGKYNEGNLPMSEVAKDLLEFYKYGGKQLYYANTNDQKTDDFSKISTQKSSVDEQEEAVDLKPGEVFIDDYDSCASGSCSI